MKKALLSVMLIVMLSVMFLTGCGKKGFDSVPYSKSTKTSEDLVTTYTEAVAGTYQLTADYETTIKTVYPQIKRTETQVIKSTVGDLNNNYFCRTEVMNYVNDELQNTVTTILYNGKKYVLTYDAIGDTTTRTQQTYTGLYPKESVLNTMFATIKAESIETVYQKTYEKQAYFRADLLLRSVNLDETIQRPEDTYYTNYEYEFGINKSGYCHMFNVYNTLIIGEQKNENTWKVYREQSIKTQLKKYGANLYIEMPDDLGTYENID